MPEHTTPLIPKQTRPVDLRIGVNDRSVEQARTQLTIGNVGGLSPETEATAYQKSVETGAPIQTIRGREIAPDLYLNNRISPSMIRFMGRSPSHAIVGQRNHDYMMGLDLTWDRIREEARLEEERRASDPGLIANLGDSLEHGNRNLVERGHLSFNKYVFNIHGGKSTRFDARLQQIRDDFSDYEEPYSASEPLRYAATSGAEVIPAFGYAIERGWKYAAAGAIIEGSIAFGLGFAGPQAAIPEEVVTVPGAAAHGAFLGFSVGMAESSFIIEAGHIADELQTFRDVDGNPLPPDIIRALAVTGGAINASLEVGGYLKLLNLVPGVKGLKTRVKRALMRDVTKKALNNPTIRRKLLKLGRQYAGVATFEGITEGAQEGVNIIAGLAAEAIGEMQTGTAFVGNTGTGQDAIRRILHASQKGFFAAAGLGGPIVATNATVQVAKARRATKQYDDFIEVLEQMHSEDLVNQSPDMVSEFMQDIGANKDYLLNARVASGLAKDEDLAADLAAVGVTEEVIANAAETGIDIPISLLDVSRMTKAGAEIVFASIKADPTAMTAAEVNQIDLERVVTRGAELENERVSIERQTQAELNRIFAVPTAEFNIDLTAQRELFRGYANYLSRNNPDNTNAGVEFLRKITVDRVREQSGDVTAVEPDSIPFKDGALDTQSDEFSTWFKESKVATPNGDALVMFANPRAVDEASDVNEAGSEVEPSGGNVGLFTVRAIDAASTPVYINAKNVKWVDQDRLSAADSLTVARDEGFDAIGIRDASENPLVVAPLDAAQVKPASEVVQWSGEADILAQQLSSVLPEEIPTNVNEVEDAVARLFVFTNLFRALVGLKSQQPKEGDIVSQIKSLRTSLDTVFGGKPKINEDGVISVTTNTQNFVDTLSKMLPVQVFDKYRATLSAVVRVAESSGAALPAQDFDTIQVAQNGSYFGDRKALAYTGQVLQMSSTRIESLNKRGGLVVDTQGYNAGIEFDEVIADAEAKGLKIRVIARRTNVLSKIADKKDIEVIAYVDAHWSQLTDKDLVEEMHRNPALFDVWRRGGADIAMMESLRNHYAVTGRQLAPIEGVLHVKRGYSVDSLENDRGLFDVSVIEQLVVGTPQEIAIAARSPISGPIVIMEDNPSTNIFSDVTGKTVSSERMGGFSAGLRIFRDDAGWHFHTAKKASKAVRNKYQEVEDHIKLQDDADALFETLQERARVAPTLARQDTAGGPVITEDIISRALNGLNERGNVTLQMQRIEFFQGTQRQENRGSMNIVDDKYLISLFNEADLSTLVHEGAHAFFFELLGQESAGTLSTEALSDVDALLLWVGAERGQELSREQHEKFARGMEAYLREGVPPTAELRGIFETFKQWFTDIYETVARLRVELTDDVRNVFGRILDSNAQVDQTILEHEMLPLTEREASNLEMTEDQKKFANDIYSRAIEKAKTKLQRLRNKQVASNNKRWASEVADEIAEDPIYQARDEVLDKGGFNLKDMKDNYSAADIKALRKSNGKFVAKKDADGVLLQMVAEPHGMLPDELLVNLMDAPSKAVRTKQLIAERIAASDITFDPLQAITDTPEFVQAMEEVGKFLENLVRGGESKGGREAIAIIAARQLSLLPIETAVRVDRFMGALSSTLRAERRAIASGKFQEALLANRQARLHWEMARLARKQRDQIGKDLRRINKSTSVKPGIIEEEYHKNMVALAARFGLLTRTPKIRVDDKGTLESIIVKQRGEHNLLDSGAAFDDFIMDENLTKNYRKLTVHDYESVMRTLAFLDGRGRALIDDKSFLDDRTFTEKKQLLIDQLEKTPAKFLLPAKLRKGQKLYDDFINGATRPLFILRWLDGAQNTDGLNPGAFEKLMWEAVTDAHKERQLLAKKVTPIVQAAGKVLGKRKNVTHTDLGVPLPEFFQTRELTWTTDRLLSVAFNMGNTYNREAVANGYGLKDADLVALTSIFTSEEWDAIQAVWDAIDSLWADQVEQHKIVNHYTPERVEATPFVVTLADGTQKAMRGGYFPVKFDPNIQLLQNSKAWNTEMNIQNAHKGSFPVTGAPAGQMQARVGTGDQAILLDTSVIGQAFDHALQYASHAATVQEIAKLLRNPQVRELIGRKHGDEVLKTLDPWLSHIANPNVNDYENASEVFNWMRGVTAITILGANASISLKQAFSVFGFINDVPVIKNRGAYAQAFKRVAANPLDSLYEMWELSPAMKSRSKGFDRELLSSVRGFLDQSLARDVREGLEQTMLIGIHTVDLLVVVPMWWTAYAVGLKNLNGNVNDAVRFADTTISASQPFNRPQDTTYFQNKKGVWYLWTMFSSFTATFGSRKSFARISRRYGKMSTAEYMRHFVLERLVPPLAMTSMFLAIHGFDDQDEDEILNELVVDALAYQFIGAPIIRDVVGNVANFAKTGQRRTVTPAAFASLDWVAATAQNTYAWSVDLDNPDKRDRALWSLADNLGSVFRLPLSQTTRKILEGQRQFAEENGNVLEILIPDPDKRK